MASIQRDNIPNDPQAWAINQVTKNPDYLWKDIIPNGEDQLKNYGDFFNERKILRKKYRFDPKNIKKKKLLKQKYGVDFFESLEIAVRHNATLNGELPVCHRFLHFGEIILLFPKRTICILLLLGHTIGKLLAPL